MRFVSITSQRTAEQRHHDHAVGDHRAGSLAAWR